MKITKETKKYIKANTLPDEKISEAGIEKLHGEKFIQTKSVKGYYVSNKRNILISTNRGTKGKARVLRLNANNGINQQESYLTTKYRDKKYKYHRLVAEIYSNLDVLPRDYDVHHIDNNIYNNRPENLVVVPNIFSDKKYYTNALNQQIAEHAILNRYIGFEIMEDLNSKQYRKTNIYSILDTLEIGIATLSGYIVECANNCNTLIDADDADAKYDYINGLINGYAVRCRKKKGA